MEKINEKIIADGHPGGSSDFSAEMIGLKFTLLGRPIPGVIEPACPSQY